ncbi:putative 2-oxoglutarate-dependent dioxygenase AOP1.2 [Camellia lanceoleosa]|uniref:2-oxoglutarate-dependent dioxygenase AOP1.2 n=1 Tax=Camellia lanceoleosa TaxID=1840588 RepID=A0ACC0FTY4_9ERIC|nr:putative 2-oxoglutarate-dependent dioxygenase AOP1.2 [Camellia lanceoleosa]
MIFERFGIEEYYKEKALDENISGNLRSMKYRLPKENEDPLGLAIHVDKAIITILCQNSVQGLEVLTKEGKWIKLNIPKGALVVIVGDGLQAWTNGRVKAVKHRVVMSGDKERLSCGFSSIPKDGVSVEIPPQLVDEEHPLRYRSFVYSDYLAKYLTSTRLDALESFASIS